jgi:D-inositol-3-phosphate glycosyltransferase
VALKALLIGPAHPLRGGIANFNESLAIAFIKNCVQAEIVSFYFQYPAFLFPGTSQKASGHPSAGLKISNLISSINPYSWYKTVKYIREVNPDLIIIQFWLPLMAPALGSIIRLLGKNRKAKVISIVHNAKPHEKKPGDTTFTKYFVNRCDGFICLSKSVLSDLSDFTPNANKVFVPHPVYDIFGEKVGKEEARNYLGIGNDEKIVLFFGIVRRYKGLELLLKSLSQPQLKEQNIKVLIAGEFYEDMAPYVAQIEALGLSKQVILHNKFIPTEAVKYYFCASDIVAQPYLNATQSGVTQIAYNFERPMLVTDVGGLSEIVFDKRTGYVTQVNETDIADALADFYNYNREIPMMQQVAIEKHRFTWFAMVDAILSLYEKLIK